MITTIDRDKAIELLERVVAERGRDFVYTQNSSDSGKSFCSYERYGEPSCGVGLALSYLGLTPEQLAEMDDLADAAVYSEDVRSYLFDLGFSMDEEANDVLCVFQGAQDSELPYGEALDRALRA